MRLDKPQVGGLMMTRGLTRAHEISVEIDNTFTSQATDGTDERDGDASDCPNDVADGGLVRSPILLYRNYRTVWVFLPRFPDTRYSYPDPTPEPRGRSQLWTGHAGGWAARRPGTLPESLGSQSCLERLQTESSESFVRFVGANRVLLLSRWNPNRV